MSSNVSRRRFLQAGAAGVAGLSLAGFLTRDFWWPGGPATPAPSLDDIPLGEVGTNWARNVTYSGQRLYLPTSVEQVQRIIRHSERVKAVGTRHSFSQIANCDHTMLSTAGLNGVEIDSNQQTVRIGSGVRFGELATALHAAGRGIDNYASLAHINVAGAVATATHGSGTQNLACQVVGIEFVNGRGEIVRLTEANDRDRFQLAVVNLGAIGVVTSLTLRTRPQYQVAQWVYENMPLESFLDNLEAILSAAYSVSVFTNWRGKTVSEIWFKYLVENGWRHGDMWLGATRAPMNRHPIVTMDPRPCTQQMGQAGPSHLRLPHFRLEEQPSSAGHEQHTEVFVERRHARAAIEALYTVGAELEEALQISEIRTVEEDQHAMSTAYGRRTVAFHFTWTENNGHVEAAMPVVRRALAPFSPRAHWGKKHAFTAQEVAAQYPRIADFREFVRSQDPSEKFLNEYLRRYVFAA